MSANTSTRTQQNRIAYSTKTRSVNETKCKRETSKHGLKERSNHQQNRPQFNINNKISKQIICSQEPTINVAKCNQLTSPSIMMQKLDNDFVQLLTQVQKYYTKLTKHEQIRVQKWIVKIIQNDQTLRWKQNRNNYLKLLYHIVKYNECLLQPFDKIPDPYKDLPYISEHEYNQRTKSLRFDGKSPAFHLHKPQIVKINQPQGDNCSVLISIVNTARTAVKDQEIAMEQIIHDENNKDMVIKTQRFDDGQIKQSQLIECSQQQFSRLKSHKVINNNESSLQTTNHDYFKGSSSAIPSNLPSSNPSQVKQSIAPYCHSSHSNNNSLFSKKQSATSKTKQQQEVSMLKTIIQNENNDQKYLIKNSGMQSVHLLDSNSNNSMTSFSHFHSNKTLSSSLQQQNVYKQLVVAMGKLLLRHQFAIQMQSKYWQLMRMIYSYQSSSKNLAINSSPQQSINSDRNDGNECFQQFLSRLKQQVGLNSMKQTQTPDYSNKIASNIRLTDNNLNHSSLIWLSKQQQIDNKQPSSVLEHLPKQQKQQQQPNKNFIYNNNDQQTVNHITEQSLDFKVQQGVESENMLYYELGDKKRQSFGSNEKECIGGRSSQHAIVGQRMSGLMECHSGHINNDQRLQSSQQMNSSLMMISDSYRQIRRNNNNNNQEKTVLQNNNLEDYHNIYDQPSQQEEEISFSGEQLIDQDEGQSVGDVDDEHDRYVSEDGQQQRSPLFTQDDDEEGECYEQQEDYVHQQQPIIYDYQDEEDFYHAHPSATVHANEQQQPSLNQ